jgi:hypothetical protein
MAMECGLQVRPIVMGFEERRGPVKSVVAYPWKDEATGLGYAEKYFSRSFFTTGVVLAHPLLAEAELNVVSSVLLEGLLSVAPFESADLGHSSARAKAAVKSASIDFCAGQQTRLASSRRSPLATSTARRPARFFELVRLAVMPNDPLEKGRPRCRQTAAVGTAQG